MKNKQGIGPLKKGNDLVTEDREKAEILNSFFASVFTVEDHSKLPNIADQTLSMPNLLITEETVKSKLKNLNVSKAYGPDGIPPRLLKECVNEIALPLTILFNKSLEKGLLPSDWKSGIVTAIFKKGDKTDAANYRPVSLTCITCKVLESIVRDACINYLDEHLIISDCQHGFRQGRSCVTQLLQVMEQYLNYLDNRTPFDILYLDFSKAFDTVPHRRLLLKLQSYGVKNNIFCWIKDFLHGRVQRVKVGASFSSDANVLSGIPQGSILGPLLFNIYINDLPNNINSHIKIFADDTKIFNSSHNSKLLQKDINSLLEWSDIWQLKFNFAKCKVLHCGLGNENKEYFFNTDTSNVKINSCSEEKDLGVIFDDKLLFDKHINKCISKANQVLGVIKRSFESKDASLILKLYKSMVRPHLEYANNIWSPHLKRQSVSIERTQRRATKIISKLQNLPYETRLKKLSLPSLKFRRLRGDLIQAFKILMVLITSQSITYLNYVIILTQEIPSSKFL